LVEAHKNKTVVSKKIKNCLVICVPFDKEMQRNNFLVWQKSQRFLFCYKSIQKSWNFSIKYKKNVASSVLN